MKKILIRHRCIEERPKRTRKRYRSYMYEKSNERFRRDLLKTAYSIKTAPDDFDLRSPEFQNQETLPKKYFCNEIRPVFPIIIWEGVPKETRSFSLSFYSIDRNTVAPFYYFIIYNIPSTVMRVDPFNYDVVGRFGKNSNGDTDYTVPCRRDKNVDRVYVFHLCAYNIDNLLTVTEKEEIDPDEIQRICKEYSISDKYLIATEEYEKTKF